MRRLLFATLALVLCLGIVPHAQANIFDTPGSYSVKFDGYEYAYWGDSSAFDSGSATLIKDNELLKPDGTLGTGFNMTAVIYMTSVNTVGSTGQPDYPAVYTPNGNGIYVSVMRDLQAAATTGTLQDRDAVIYFTGGVLDWYFLPDAQINDISTMYYQDGVGVADAKGGTLSDLLAGLTPFAQFTLAETVELNGSMYTGSALVGLRGGALWGEADFFADTTPGGIFDSNAFYGYDMAFQATLSWNSGLNRFQVNDPASLQVPTPEPGTLSLMALGLLLTGFCLRRRSAR